MTTKAAKGYGARPYFVAFAPSFAFFVFQTALIVAAILLLIFALAGCAAAGDAGGTLPRIAGVPAAQAAGAQAPRADFSVTGRLIVVKDGAIQQWSQGSLRQLAGGARYHGPTFSPDGARIAVSTVGDNHSDLLLLDSSGKRLQQLTDNWSKSRVQDSAWAFHPAWSHDGGRIAYSSDAMGAEMSLWVWEAGSGNRRRVYPAPAYSGVERTTWSPAGQEVAITFVERGGTQISLVSVTLGPVKSLTEREEGAYDPAWSPSGDHIAFVARTGGRSDIWLMGADGSRAVRLTDLGTARAPAWSPSGDLLAFLADQGGSFDLYALKPNLAAPAAVPSSEIKRLTNSQRLDAPSGVSWAR